MKCQPGLIVAWMALTPLLLTTGCASSGTSPEPSPVVPELAPQPAPSPQPAPPPTLLMRDLYEAGDYAAAVRVFLEYPTLASQDLAVFRAAVASAMPGHAAHDPARALTLFNRLVAEFPDSDYLTEARLLSNLLQTTRALRGRNERLEQELERMKAIDLGQQP